LSNENYDTEVGIEAIADEKRGKDDKPGRRYPSTFSTRSTEKTVRLTNQIQISKTDTPNHLNNSFCLNSILAASDHYPTLHV